jgi:hypothetical protein
MTARKDAQSVGESISKVLCLFGGGSGGRRVFMAGPTR